GVTTTDILPSGYTYVSNDLGASYVPVTGIWTIGNLANGATASLNITATVLATGSYANTATVTSTTMDPTPGNNTDINTPVPNHIPIAFDDSQTTFIETPVTIPVLGNDTGLEDGGLAVTITVNPTNGTFVVNGDNTVTYTPNAGFTGTDTFIYQVCDADGDCATATVTITVNPTAINHLPVAVNDTTSTKQDTPVTIPVLGNDSGLEDGGLMVTITVNPTNGTFVVNGDNTVTYTPNAGFTGIDIFTYQVCDANGDCTTATVTITVIGTVIVPEGFSPNGDGVNDNFVIPGLDNFDKLSVEIFNRWGNVVYKEEHYKNDWDGKANVGFTIGSDLPVGTYFFLVTIHDNGKKITGYVYITR
ncbi:Ig-like domain-containing protein, partial [Williamwhitmania taraxaci]